MDTDFEASNHSNVSSDTPLTNGNGGMKATTRILKPGCRVLAKMNGLKDKGIIKFFLRYFILLF